MDEHGAPGGDPATTMAAFPLSTVLLPGQLMELRVFEPRYRVMLFDLREADPAEFVANMIERGSEVGGGDVRAPLGCVARVIEQSDLTDGTTSVSVEGTERVRVDEWLVEDPYPRARVTRLPAGTGGPLDLSGAERLAGSVIDLAQRLGATRPRRPAPLPADTAGAIWQLALATPLAIIDRYRLLATDDLRERLGNLETMLAELRDLLAASVADRGERG